MADTPRPVSGEIMTDGRAVPARRHAPGDFVDAEFEPVGAPVPAIVAAPSTVVLPVPVRGMDMLSGIGGRVERATRGGVAFWSAGLLLVAGAFWISGGHSLVGEPDRKAQMRQPLAIEAVESRVEERDGRRILFVEGEARNRSGAAAMLPPISVAVTQGGGVTLRHVIGSGGTSLAPGERFAFSSRVEAPGGGVRSVAVTFLEGAR